MRNSSLEAQLLEEPLGLSSLVLGLQGFLQLSANLLLLGRILEELAADGGGSVQFKVVTSGHQVGIIDDLDKGLDARATSDLLLVHGLGNLQGSTLHPDDQSAAKLFVGGLVTFVKV